MFWPDRDFLPRSLPKPEEEEEVPEEQPVEQAAWIRLSFHSASYYGSRISLLLFNLFVDLLS